MELIIAISLVALSGVLFFVMFGTLRKKHENGLEDRAPIRFWLAVGLVFQMLLIHALACMLLVVVIFDHLGPNM